MFDLMFIYISKVLLIVYQPEQANKQINSVFSIHCKIGRHAIVSYILK